MFLKEGPDISPLMDQLKAILSLKLISSSKSILEKLFWSIIAFGGTIYIANIVTNQITYWDKNPVLKTNDIIPLSELKLPAITFCHKGIQKYALAERLGNYIDCNKNIPKEIFELRSHAIRNQVFKLPLQTALQDNFDACLIRKDNQGKWIEEQEHEHGKVDGCQEFGKKLFLISQKFGISIQDINHFVFELITTNKLWNLTSAFSKLENGFDQIYSHYNHSTPHFENDTLKSIHNFVVTKSKSNASNTQSEGKYPYFAF